MNEFTRRAILGYAAAGCAALALGARGAQHVPIAAELYCVRDDLKRDPAGTLRAIARMGYEAVEFSGAYFEYTADRAGEIRKLLDELNLRCVGTHNSPKYFASTQLERAIELNRILGGKYLIQASAPNTTTEKGWREVAERLNQVAEALRPHGMRTGYHNHAGEFQPVDGKVPWEIIAANTVPDVVLQLDIGFLISVGRDPVECMNAYPGRMATIHVKDYSSEPDRGFKVVFGEGSAKWAEIFRVAETVGRTETYIIEQDATKYPPLETMERCLANLQKLRAAMTEPSR